MSSNLINRGLFTSNSDEYATPDDLFKRLDDEFHFDLDPCASAENHKCDLYYTIADDGLTKDWAGHRVFCNPPYSRVRDFVKKANEESKKPGTLIVMLVFARTDTRWFHDYVYGQAELRFIKGRVRFNGMSSNAPFPSMIVIFDNEVKQ